MAMVMQATTTSTSTSDLHSFLSKAKLHQYHSRLEGDLHLRSVSQLQQLNDLSYLSQTGMTKMEIEQLKKLLKKQDTHSQQQQHGFFSKSKKVKRDKPSLVSNDESNPSKDGKRLFGTSTKELNLTSGKKRMCGEKLSPGIVTNRDIWLPMDEKNKHCDIWRPTEEKLSLYTSFCGQLGLEVTEGQKSLGKQEVPVKRSTSAVSDCSSSGVTQTTTTSSLARRIGLRSDDSAHRLAGSDPDSEIYKDLNQVFSCHQETSNERRPSTKSQIDSPANNSTTMNEVVIALSGPSYKKPDAAFLGDRSPLLELDAPPFILTKNSFDNIAAVESASISRNSSETMLACLLNSSQGHEPAQRQNDYRHELTIDEEGIPVNKSPTTKSAADKKKKKWKQNRLRITIPKDSEVDVKKGTKLNLKQLSIAEERELNEAIALASSFARLSTDGIMVSTPRTPGVSSKESLSGSTESPTGHFFFSFRKNRPPKEEKKTFVDGLQTSPDVVNLLTPEALEAYDKLVTKTLQSYDVSNSTFKHPTKQALHSSVNRGLVFRHPRNSLSESDKVPIPGNDLQRRAVVERRSESGGDQFRLRFGSSGKMPSKNNSSSSSKTSDEKLFEWFEKNPLNIVSKPEVGLRSKSCQSNLPSNADDGVSNAFRLEMPPTPCSTPVRKESYSVTYANQTSCNSSSSCETPSIKETEDYPLFIESPSSAASSACAPPPPLPPRQPLAQSTVNTKPRQRRFPLSSRAAVSLTDRKRSYSEDAAPKSTGEVVVIRGHEQIYDIPRREVHSTDMGSIQLDQHHPFRTGSNRQDSTHGSDDSVFTDGSRSPNRSTTGRKGQETYKSSSAKSNLGPHRSLSVKNVKLNAAQLGIYNKDDPFWVNLDQCHSETDLVREASAPIPGRYETSDCISYEDLMEFALDGPGQHNNPSNVNGENAVCDEIRVMRKIFSNEVPVEDCMNALVETRWDVHSAVKLVKLKQVLSTGLGDTEGCKDALMSCKWNVHDAASYLLAPPIV